MAEYSPYINEVLRQLQAQVGRQMAQQLNISFVDMVVNASAQALALGITDLVDLGDAIRSGGIPSATLKDMHEQIGKAAQISVARGFDQRRPRRRVDQNFPAYARRPNRAAGALRRAIMNPDFYEANAYGVKFINTAILDQEANHWRRLNFGAGAGAIRPPARVGVNWGGLVVGALGLDPDPRPAFRMPPGFWLRAGRYGQGGRQESGAPGTGGFFPTGRRLVTPTYGIVATNFLDAGVNTLARLFPLAYQEAYRRYFEGLHPERQTQLSEIRMQRLPTQRPDLAPSTKLLFNSLNRYYQDLGRPEALTGDPVRKLTITQGPRFRPPRMLNVGVRG